MLHATKNASYAAWYGFFLGFFIFFPLGIIGGRQYVINQLEKDLPTLREVWKNEKLMLSNDRTFSAP